MSVQTQHNNIDRSPASRPLRVLVVTGIYPTEQRPAAGTFIKQQVDSLIAEGLDVEVLHPRLGPMPLRYAEAAAQVFRKTLTGRFDVVHGHYSFWSLIARLQWTSPVVASFLGDDLLGTVSADHKSHTSKTRFFTTLSRQLCYWVDAVIVKSEQMKKAAGGPQQKISVIPNGINFAQFKPIPRAEARATLGWEQDRSYVVFCNNPNIPVKNFPLAQAAMEQLRARGIEAELMVANGIPHDRVMLYMNASNALLLTSVAEGSPNVVKEAMACNVPVVSTAVGDVSEVIGRTAGCSVCPHDPEALAAGLEKALLHTERTTGREDIQYLDSALIAKKVIAVYQKAIGKQVGEEGAVSSSTKEKVYAQES